MESAKCNKITKGEAKKGELWHSTGLKLCRAYGVREMSLRSTENGEEGGGWGWGWSACGR